MSAHTSKKILLFALVVGMALPATAQIGGIGRSFFGPNKRSFNSKASSFLNGFQIGGGYILSDDAEFNHNFVLADAMGNNIRAIRDQGRAEVTGFDVHVGSQYTLARISRRNSIALTYGVQGTLLTTTPGRIAISPTAFFEQELKTTEIGLPIGVAYKFGGESSLDRSDKVSFTVGAAAMPIYSMQTYGDIKTTDFKLRPLAFAEAGFLAGIEFKIRATVIPLTNEGFRIESGDEGLKGFPNNNTEITGRFPARLSLGIAIMPFTRKWEKDRF